MTDNHDSAIGPAESYPAGPIDSEPSQLPRTDHRDAASPAHATDADAASQGAAPTQYADTVVSESAGQLADERQLASTCPAWPRRTWRGFRTWRRSRPFWGGLLVLLAAGEIFLTERAPVAIIVHLGAQGLAGYVVPIVMGVCALLLWFNPGQRLFYAIISVLASLGSFIVSNLGGFLLGMLLGVLGGSLAFAWTPLPPGEQARRRGRHRPAAPASTGVGLPSLLDSEDVPDPRGENRSAAETTDDRGSEAAEAVPNTADRGTEAHLASPWAVSRSDTASYGGGAADDGTVARGLDPAERPAATESRLVPPYISGPDRGTIIGGNILIGLLSLLTGGLLNLSPTTAATQSAGLPAATASPSPSPSASASPSPSTSPSASATPSVSPSPGPSLGASASPTGGASPSASASPSPAPTGTAPPFAISAAQSALTASSASITGFAYDGVVSVPTAAGNVQMMQFSATSLDLNDVRLAVSQGGGTLTTTATTLDLSGNVVLYTAELSGNLLGIPITITPNTPLATILQILGQGGVSQVTPLQMTNVTTLQPFTSANGMTTTAVNIS